ncbi:NYN domain-containing protein [Neomoorella humiferrea]|uniref:NYN domain-containing protein n=1 Tax=Neomoorella humiferrea TaxID=676965 RepID=UPI003D934038
MDEKQVKDNEQQEEEKRIEALKFVGDIFSLSAERAYKAMNTKNKMENVAIFVDYDNVYWGLMNSYKHDPDHEEPDKNLFIKLWEHFGRDNIRLFKVYGDFQQIRTSLTSLQRKRIQIRHVYANGKTEDRRKNASDIELCIDAIETTYKDPSITCYVFVTADSDMIPIMSRLMYKGKYVILYYNKSSAPKGIDITNYAHESWDLLEFLNVDVKDYNLEDYVDEAIRYIDNWQKENENNERYLGSKWLSNNLSNHLAIPLEIASRLIDLLKAEQIIIETYKTVNKKPYPNWVLNKKHNRVLAILQAEGSQKEIAATIE